MTGSWTSWIAVGVCMYVLNSDRYRVSCPVNVISCENIGLARLTWSKITVKQKHELYESGKPVKDVSEPLQVIGQAVCSLSQSPSWRQHYFVPYISRNREQRRGESQFGVTASFKRNIGRSPTRLLKLCRVSSAHMGKSLLLFLCMHLTVFLYTLKDVALEQPNFVILLQQPHPMSSLTPFFFIKYVICHNNNLLIS